MKKTLFDRVTPIYRSAVIPQSHWMAVRHPYFIPIQPPPPPGCCCPAHGRPVLRPTKYGPECILNQADIPCCMVSEKPRFPVANPAIPDPMIPEDRMY